MKSYDLLDPVLLARAFEERYVAAQQHPTERLTILNYTQRCQFDRAWNDVTRQCRGLIYDAETNDVVARPWPKFFNYGEHEEGTLDLDAPVRVTDKLDGSLGILYPVAAGDSLAEPPRRLAGHAIATRGSFTSDQALHATEVWNARYAGKLWPRHEWTYLVEIVYPENRIVVDYEGLDDLILLAVLDTATGQPVEGEVFWPGPVVDAFEFGSLAQALEAEPRPNCEGLVVHFSGTATMLKQEDYVALHRILTGTNARNVWEIAAVQACADYVAVPKHWGSFLGIDPARAAECLALDEAWLDEIPDEFHDWVRRTTEDVCACVDEAYRDGLAASHAAAGIADRAERYRFLQLHPSAAHMVTEIMRLASCEGFAKKQAARNQLWLRCWREASPEPTAPFARSEAVA